MFRKEEDRLID